MDTKWTPGAHTAHKCRCGHKGCDQYILSTQRSAGFDKADADLYTAAPDMDDALALADAALVEALSECRDYADTHPFIQQVDAARAAIKAVRAKARGNA